MRKSKGFTLIELLIVVAIIGILATVVILNVSSARTKAQDAKIKEDLGQVWKAYNVFVTFGGSRFPYSQNTSKKLENPDVWMLVDDNKNKLMEAAPIHPRASSIIYYEVHQSVGNNPYIGNMSSLSYSGLLSNTGSEGGGLQEWLCGYELVGSSVQWDKCDQRGKTI